MLNIYCEDSEVLAIDKVIDQLKERNVRDSNHIIIAPASFTLGIETAILERLGVAGTFNISVYNFHTITTRILEKEGRHYLTKNGAIMLMRSAIKDCYERLGHYKSISKMGNFPVNIYNTIEELRMSGYSPQDLIDKEDELEPVTKLKIKDIILIFETYLEKLNNLRPDLLGVYDVFIDNIEKDTLIKSSYVYVMGFNTLSAKEIELIQALTKVAKDVFFSLSFVPGEEVNQEVTPRKTFTKLVEKIGSKNIGVYIKGRLEKNYSFMKRKNKLEKETSLDELDFVRREIFSYSDKKFNGSKKIKLYVEDNIFNELNAVAQEIVSLVRQQGYRFGDFVVFNSLKEYNFAFKEIFKRYDIPVYLPEKLVLSDTIIFKHLISLVEFAKNPQNMNKFFDCIKTPLFYDYFSTACDLENYILEKNYKYADLTGIEEPEYGELIESVLSLIAPFSQKKEMTIEKLTKHSRSIIEGEGLKNSLLSILVDSLEVQNVQERAIKELSKVLDEIEEILKDETVSLQEYINILTSSAMGITITSIPQRLDCVSIAQIGRSKFYKNKAAFFIGLTNNSCYDLASSDKILNISDNESMEKAGIPIYPLAAERIKNSRYELVEMFSKFERLYFGYSKLILSNNIEKPSVAFLELLRILNIEEKDLASLYQKFTPKSLRIEDLDNYIVNAKDAYFKFLQFQNAFVDSEALEKHYRTFLIGIFEYLDIDMKNTVREFQVETCKDSESKVKNLLSYCMKDTSSGDYMSSVSQLETYFTCPFRHFLSYALRAKPRPEGQLLVATIGILLHDILELFFSQYTGEKGKQVLLGKSKESIAKEVKECFSRAIKRNDLAFIQKINSTKYFVEKLEEEAIATVQILIENMRKSKYWIFAVEAQFGKGKTDISSWDIKLDTGQQVILGGKIDRIDIAECSGMKFASVIDYKSGNKDIKISGIYTGRSIQLLVYLAALLNSDKALQPGIAAYLRMKDAFAKVVDALEGEEEESEKISYASIINSDFEHIMTFSEITKSEEVDKYKLEALDMEIEIKINKKKKEEIKTKMPAAQGLLLSTVEITQLIEYVARLIKATFNEIKGGNTERAPFKIKEDCKYCDYQDICSIFCDKRERPIYSYISKDIILSILN